VEDAPRAFGNQVARDVAGRDDPVVGLARHAERAELRLDVRERARRIGDQHDREALLPCPDQCRGGLVEGPDAVVDDTPDVTQQRAVTVGDVVERSDHSRQVGHGRSSLALMPPPDPGLRRPRH
jgi:NAD(P)-dependent dehydrogenase (short-subunit alcohol dehydrogenase family)